MSSLSLHWMTLCIVRIISQIQIQKILLGVCWKNKDSGYMLHEEKKEEWYQKDFPGKLIVTFDSNNLSKDVRCSSRNIYNCWLFKTNGGRGINI